jgi:hypothetical protein
MLVKMLLHGRFAALAPVDDNVAISAGIGAPAITQLSIHIAVRRDHGIVWDSLNRFQLELKKAGLLFHAHPP